MHVVTGGAANGKATWVKEFYQLDEHQPHEWFNAYEEQQSITNLEKKSGIVVIEGVEHWVFQWLEGENLDAARRHGQQLIDQWLLWEKQEERNRIVIICTDISKGIVPMEKNMRNWRDVTGWFYQDLVRSSDKTHYIWYGIAKHLK